jgi:uncharacterized membrane protein YfcA
LDDLLLFALAGFCASFVDGALGMGFGPTSSSILLSTGLPPSVVSTAVNLAKVATGVAAGISHWRFKNIDKSLVLRLAIPGCVGALLGVTVLSNVSGKTLKPILAALLFVVGVRILFRFARRVSSTNGNADTQGLSDRAPTKVRGVEIAAVTGGMTNGLIGAWGPVVTPFLLHRGVAPRFAIGSVNTAEVFVAALSAGTLVSAFGSGGLDLKVVGAMLVGGVIAAPVAAWVIRHVPARPLGVMTAALLLLTNTRELLSWAGIKGTSSLTAYATVVAVIALASLAPRAFARPAPDQAT